MSTTKEKIIDTVTQLLSNNVGFDEISMSSLAMEVGIGKSTIYEYFTSKVELFIYTEELLLCEYFLSHLPFKCSRKKNDLKICQMTVPFSRMSS